jgi:signal transduction histidine kinase
MVETAFPNVEQSIARCRLMLSVAALVAVLIDPTQPILIHSVPLSSSHFNINVYALVTLITHLAYSAVIFFLTRRQLVALPRLISITTWCDVLFGAVIAGFTEGIASPSYAFFAFAVMEAGLRAGFRRTLLIAGVSVGLYLSLVVLSVPENNHLYVMRSAYLAITGYLVGYLGQQRLNLEAGIRELAAANQRQQIARDLHDGRAQALAGITLRLESCRELLRRGRNADALADLEELQTSVNREYDELRVYMRSLVGLESTEAASATGAATRFSVDVKFQGSALLVDQVLQILREGVANVLQHARAGAATFRVQTSGPRVFVTMDDDGVGLSDHSQQPWSIASRVRELGGRLQVQETGEPGAHLAITLPGS